MDFIFKVDPIRRNIKVPDGFTVLTMDHNVHKLVFVCPYFEDFAFDSASIVFMVDAPDGQQYIIPAEEYESFPNSPAPYVKFTLTLKSYITSVVGYISFCITADIISSGNVIEKSWHTKNITIGVGGHIDNDDSGEIPEEDVPTINQRLNNLDSKVGRLQTTVNGMSGGAPPTASSTSGMNPEVSPIYVNTTDGNWYYYNGSAWQIGGVYGGAVTDTTLSIEGAAADAKAAGDAIADKADADDLTAVQTAVAEKADADSVDVLDNKIDAVIDSEIVVTWEICDKDDERFTQISGYISATGGISSPSSEIHKIWYFVPEHDINVYVTRATSTGQVKLGVYNDENIASGNINQYGTTGPGGAQYPLPTEEEPFHALAGQCVVVSIYNSSVLDWVLHVGTESTTGALKQTIGLTDQMETEVDAKVSSIQSEVDVHDLLINTFHSLINYGYDIEESREPVPSATDSTVFGYHRKKYVITVSGGLDAKNAVIKLNGNIETTVSTSTVRGWTASVPLEEGRTYRFTAQMISGELSSVESDDYDVGVSVYKSDASTSRGSYTVSADRKKFVREVIGEGVLYNICLFINSGVTLTNAKYLVIMEDITEEQEESSETIETYFLPEMEDTIAKVRDCADSPALVFPLVTDIHRYSSASQTFDKMIANMRKFTKEVKCDFIVNMGDTIEGNAQQETSLEYAYDSSADFCNIGIPYFFANGNHDNNPYISSATLKFNIQQTFKAFYAGVKGVTYNVAENGTDYYIDFENLGVRLISLNSCNVNVSATYAYGTSTASWLASALDTTHAVIVVTHVSPIPAQVWNNNSPSNNTSIRNTMQDFVDGGGKLILFAGHSHVDATFIDPWLSIMQVCQKFEQADITTEAYGKMSGYIDVLGNPARTSETYTEDAWSVCVYKPFEDVLDMIRFGAGADRYIHLVPIGAGTVTSQLDDVTWSSSDTSVATVSGGVITEVGAGRCAIIAKDSSGNIEVWIVEVTE